MAVSLVVLDAGHGGSDPGAVGHGHQEKHLALAVCHRLALALKRRGIAVEMTRRKDEFVALSARARYANTLKADAFVSVHCNAHTAPSAEGIETLHHPASAKGRALAEAIQGQLTATFHDHKDRGLKPRGDLAVLRMTAMPAALVELEFISHPAQAAFLADPHQQERMAKAIADGLTAWLLNRKCE